CGLARSRQQFRSPRPFGHKSRARVAKARQRAAKATSSPSSASRARPNNSANPMKARKLNREWREELEHPAIVLVAQVFLAPALVWEQICFSDHPVTKKGQPQADETPSRSA